MSFCGICLSACYGIFVCVQYSHAFFLSVDHVVLSGFYWQIRTVDVGRKPFKILKSDSCVDLAHGVETGHKSHCAARTFPLLQKISINSPEEFQRMFMIFYEIR